MSHNDEPAPAAAANDTAAAKVTAARLAADEPDQWLTSGRDANGTYYSPLKDIDTTNVTRLGFAWDYRLGTNRGRSRPRSSSTASCTRPAISAGCTPWTQPRQGIMDLRSAHRRSRARYACCDAVNRGLVAFDGRLFVGALDGWLHAIDARTGRTLWKTDTLIGRSEHKPYTITGAPLLAGDLIIVGNGGADFAGARGYVSAYDQRSGALRWRFFTVPHDPAEGPQDQPHLEAAVKTWDPRHRWSAGVGGTVWDGMAFDPALKLVYIGTANAAPYNSHLGGRHGGDELYAASIIAIHADNGSMAWYYQTTPGDRWDYDSTQKMILADVDIGGRRRAVLMQAAKNGFYYVLDRATANSCRRASSPSRTGRAGSIIRPSDRSAMHAPTTITDPNWYSPVKAAPTAGSRWRMTRCMRGPSFPSWRPVTSSSKRATARPDWWKGSSRPRPCRRKCGTPSRCNHCTAPCRPSNSWARD